MKSLNKTLLAAFFVFALALPTLAFFGPKIEGVDQAYLKERLGQTGVVVVDVRSEEIYNGKSPRGGIPGGHIPGAINFPLAKLKEDGAAVNLTQAGIVKDVEVIVYCNTGRQSSHFAAALIKDFGFDPAKVKNYTGGAVEWSKDPANTLLP